MVDIVLVLPHVMGHEFAGVVQEVGADCMQFRMDDRVTAPFILVYARQMSLLGMRGLGVAGFAALLDLVDAGALDLGELVTKRIQLSDVGGALSLMDRGQPAGITVVDNFIV